MNQYPGILGRKIGMSQVVADDGTVTPVTVILAQATVVGKRTADKHGYTALVLGFGERKAKHTSKPRAGQFAKAGVKPAVLTREFRCDAAFADKYEIGAEVKAEDVFSVGQFVDVAGVSRGRGFTGVMRRHNFSGAKRSHGVHEYKRHGGSLGTNMTPGRVLPGRKMAGQYGNTRVSVLNQKVVSVLADKGLVLIAGGVPGAKNGMVELRGAVKKNGGKAAISL
jgi:large subunit ribosomal protein L3